MPFSISHRYIVTNSAFSRPELAEMRHFPRFQVTCGVGQRRTIFTENLPGSRFPGHSWRPIRGVSRLGAVLRHGTPTTRCRSRRVGDGFDPTGIQPLCLAVTIRRRRSSDPAVGARGRGLSLAAHSMLRLQRSPLIQLGAVGADHAHDAGLPGPRASRNWPTVTNGGSVRRGSYLAYEWDRDNVECLKASSTVLVLSPDQHYRSRMPQFAGYSKHHHVLRRDVMLAALASSLPIGFADSAAASPLNPEHTIIRRLSPTYRPPPERGAEGASADYADGTVDRDRRGRRSRCCRCPRG
jgi:hypothetical protein